MRRVAWLVLVALLLVAATAAQDPLRAEQWHLDHVRAPEAWQVGEGAGVIVAVLDTGVDLDHPDLAGQLIGGVDLVDRGTPPDDEHGHGTLVAGVIAAVTGNGVGVAGTAPRARVMPVRVLDAAGSGQSSTVVEGIRWAVAHGAGVVNLSLAGEGSRGAGLTSLVTTDVEEAIREASRRGVLVVAAAGNNGQSRTPYSHDLPALVVGASDRNDGVWPASNRDARTLFAPGVEIASTWAHEPGYARGDGTSFAAPIVAAGGAILRGRGLSEAQARERLTSTAVPVAGGLGRMDLAAAVGVGANPTQQPASPRSVAPPPPAPPPPPAATEAAAEVPPPTKAPMPVASAPAATAAPVPPQAQQAVPPAHAATPATLAAGPAAAAADSTQQAPAWLLIVAVLAILLTATAAVAETLNRRA